MASAIPDTTVNEDNPTIDNYRDLNAVFTDAQQGSALSFTIQSNTNPGLVTPTIGADSALDLSFIADANGTATITVRATDGFLESVDDVFVVTVNAVNDDPTVAAAIPDTTVTKNSPTVDNYRDLKAVFTDLEEGSALTFTIQSNTNSGLVTPTIVPADSTLDLSFTADQIGTATITIRATDGGALFVDDVFTVTVNDPPTVAAAIPDTTVNEDNPTIDNYRDLKAVFTDAEDGSALTFVIQSNTNPGLVTPTIGADSALDLSFIADANGTATITVRATDSGPATVDDVFTVTVNSVNDQPTVIAAIPDTTVIENNPTIDNYRDLNAVFDDPEDGSALTFTIQNNTNPGLVTPTIGADSAVDLSFTASTFGASTITIRATDGGALYVDDVFTVTVNQAAGIAVATDTCDMGQDGSAMDATGSIDLFASDDWGAFCFVNVNIPQGATILSALFKIYAFDTSDDSPNVFIDFEQVDSATTLATTSNNISLRWTETGNKVTWDADNIGTGQVASPDLSVPLQAIINRVGWKPGNSLMLILDQFNSGDLEITSIGENASKAARLDIQYTVAVNTAPTVASAIPDTTVNEGSTIDNYRDLNAVFTDSQDGSQLNFFIQSNTNPGLVTPTIGADSALDLSFTAGVGGVATITVRATDSGALFVDDVFTVTTNCPAGYVCWDGGGGGDPNWSNGLNWTGDAVPGYSDLVVFNGLSSNPATFNAVDTIGGFTIEAGYTGTITMAADLLIDHTSGCTFTQNGGTIDLGSVTWEHECPWTHTAGTFTVGTSTVKYRYSTIAMDAGTSVFNDVSIGIASNTDFTVTGTMNVDGDLTITEVRNIDTGTIAVAGNVTTTDLSVTGSGIITFDGAGAQVLGASGGRGALPSLNINNSLGGTLTLQDTVEIEGYLGSGWVYTTGTVDAGTSTVVFATATTANSGSMAFNNVIVEMATNRDLTVTGTMDVDGDLTITSVRNIKDGTITVAGDLTSQQTGVGNTSGLIILDGANAQFIDINTGDVPDGLFVINKTNATDTVTLSSAMNLSGSSQDLTITQGVLALGAYDLTVADVLTVDANGDITCTTGTVSALSEAGAGLPYSCSGNSTPTVASAIADTTVWENSPAIDNYRDLKAVFTDVEDGSGLTYTIQSNTNSGLVTPTIVAANSTLDLSFTASTTGTATITVRATDSGALFVDDVFTVTVNATDNIMMIVIDSGAPTTSDQALTTYLQSNGLTVVYADDNDSEATFESVIAANSIVAVYISESVGGSALLAKANNLSVGIVTANSGTWEDNLLGNPESADLDVDTRIINNTHYITSPFATGVLTTWTTSSSRGYTGGWGTGATVLAEDPGNSARAHLLVYEKNALLEDNSAAPERRAGIFTDDVYANMHANTKTLVLRTIQWAGSLGGSANTAPTVASAIADTTVAENNPTIDNYRDLKAVFTDAEEGSGLTYSIQSNTNSGLVTPTIVAADSTLDLSFTASTSGTATITIRATDSPGLFVEDVFTVTVNGTPTVVSAIADTTVNENDPPIDNYPGPQGGVHGCGGRLGAHLQHPEQHQFGVGDPHHRRRGQHTGSEFHRQHEWYSDDHGSGHG